MEKLNNSVSGIQLPLSKLFERASSILGVSTTNVIKAPALDGEIVYSKNNVCVHQVGTDEPIPGYLSLRCSVSDTTYNNSGSTLILHWVPNVTIQKNPKSLDSPRSTSPRSSSIEILSQSLNSSDAGTNQNVGSKRGKLDYCSSTDSLDLSTANANNSANHSIGEPVNAFVGPAKVVNGDSVKKCTNRGDLNRDSLIENLAQSISDKLSFLNGPSQSRPTTLSLADNIIEDCEDNRSISSGTSGSTGGPDSHGSCSPTSEISSMCDVISLTETAESIAKSHNLLFPTDACSEHVNSCSHPPKPSVFSVDLGSMRSLRLFYAEDSTSCGQLVIASRESQYKIFHFYNGGLDKLAEILEDWNLFQSAKRQRWKRGSTSPLTRQFRVVRPLSTDESGAYSEENLYQPITSETWKLFMNDVGQICDEQSLKKAIFFGGIDPSLRKDIWPYLLHYYPYGCTYEQWEQIRHDGYVQYQKLRKKREKLTLDEVWYKQFWRTVQNIVEKDVVRTDRGHSYYKGEGNSNVNILKDILLNYAVAHPHLGYTQGMSDLLSPLLAEMKNDADAYWCFVGLMQRTIFVSTPRDADMDKQLTYLKELLRIMFPRFYCHLMSVGEALGLLFVHRWILLCFKREFNEHDAMSIWETCWANIQTDYFHLFIALSIIMSYSDDVLQESLPADEMLLHFSNLAHHMNGQLILRKARRLLHQFRLLEKIPCTLQGLCSMSHTGMWDSGHVPAVECVGHQGIAGCPYLGVSTTPITIDDHVPLVASNNSP